MTYDLVWRRPAALSTLVAAAERYAATPGSSRDGERLGVGCRLLRNKDQRVLVLPPPPDAPRAAWPKPWTADDAGATTPRRLRVRRPLHVQLARTWAVSQ